MRPLIYIENPNQIEKIRVRIGSGFKCFVTFYFKGRAWHKACFKCATCHRVLDSRIACDGPDGNVYCTGCYRKSFGLKGYGFGQGGPALMSGDLAERCEV